MSRKQQAAICSPGIDNRHVLINRQQPITYDTNMLRASVVAGPAMNRMRR